MRYHSMQTHQKTNVKKQRQQKELVKIKEYPEVLYITKLYSHFGKSYGSFFNKVTIKFYISMPPSIYSKYLHKRKHMPTQRCVHECTLFITARNRRKSKHLSIDEWINKQQYFNQYHFIIKMNKILTHVVTSMNFKSIMLNERNLGQDVNSV